MPRRSQAMAKCILRKPGTVHHASSPPSEPIPMRKPLTGEPCAGEPHARFGGRGGRASFSTPIKHPSFPPRSVIPAKAGILQGLAKRPPLRMRRERGQRDGELAEQPRNFTSPSRGMHRHIGALGGQRSPRQTSPSFPRKRESRIAWIPDHVGVYSWIKRTLLCVACMRNSPLCGSLPYKRPIGLHCHLCRPSPNCPNSSEWQISC